MADHAGIAIALSEADGVEGLGQSADLIDFDEDRIGDAFDDAFLEDRRVGDEEVVADELDFIAKALGELLPAFPIAFGEAVFDGDDGRIFFDHPLEVTDHLLGGLLAFFGFDEVIDAIAFIEFAGSDVHAEEDLFAELVAGFLNRFRDEGERLFVALLAGRSEAAFVADAGFIAVGFDDFLEGVEDLSPGAEGFTEGGEAGGDDEEFLEIDGGLRVGAAVDDVHARSRDDFAVGAADVAI